MADYINREWTIFKCSECGNNNGRRYNDKYCRFCGAKMDLDEVTE